MNNYPSTNYVNPITLQNSKSEQGTVVLGFDGIGRVVYQVYCTRKGLKYTGDLAKIERFVNF